MKNTLKLDKFQAQAINHKDKPLLIIAGAGTGKTTVITQRIKHLIMDEKISSSNILALTFTDKASFEMQERIDILLPYGYTNLWIHTFHSFCDKILKNESFAIGLNPNYKLITQAESILLLKKHIFDLKLSIYKPLNNPTKFLDGLLTHFSRLKDEDITPNKYLAWAKNIKDKEIKIEYLELANAYKIYEDLKIKESVMDFADLISNTLLLFRQRPNILKRYQDQFKYILVDEFQDTNYAQNELAILLSGSNKNITVVADDDQSIYRFRGAAISNVLQFKKNFPESKIIVLSNNYRSTQTILDASYNLIQKNNPNRLEISEKINKKLKSNVKTKSKEIKLIFCQRAEDEAENIAKEIKKIGKKIKYSDIAILVRANNHSKDITRALQRNRIPFQFLGPGYLFMQEEVKDLIAYLSFLADLTDSVSLFRVLSMEILAIPIIELNYLLNYARKKNLSLFQTFSDLNLDFLTDGTKEKLKSFNEMVIKHLTQLKRESAGQILYYFLVDSGIFETFNDISSVKKEKEIQNIAKFFDRIKNFETEKQNANIYETVEWLQLMIQLGDSPSAVDLDTKELNAVNILTVHAAKGLEFKAVFLINLVNDRFPTRERSEKIPLPDEITKEKIDQDIDFHLQEERRLFYVGMTRAKEILYFTAAQFYGEGKRLKRLSPFVFESVPNLLSKQNAQVNSKSLEKIQALYSDIPEETTEVKNPLKIDYINYSNLQMFDICPLHYKAKAILNIPTPKSFVQSFGISLHNTLYNYYKLVLENEKPSLKDIYKILNREWINEGYNNKNHEAEKYKQAKKIIKNYFTKECNPPAKPLAIELPFSFTLKNGVKVSGKIDRIDKNKENGIEIIDYKTGLDNPKADSAHKLQLVMYALAAVSVKDEILNKKAEDITLTLYFLEEGTKKSMTFTNEDLILFENELINKITEIEQSNFKCSKNILCKNCEFKILCNA